MKKMTRRQVDKLFTGVSHDLYDKFIESAVILYANLFPESCTSKTFDHSYYDMIRERLQVEFGVLYVQANGEKKIENRFKKPRKKRAVV